MFNSAFVSTKRIVMNEEDFLFSCENPDVIPYTTHQANMMTSDLDALEQEFSKLDLSYRVNYNLSRSMLKSTYIMDILVTVILLDSTAATLSIDKMVKQVGVQKMEKVMSADGNMQRILTKK